MDFFFLGIENVLGKDNNFVKLNKLIDFTKFNTLLKGIRVSDGVNQSNKGYSYEQMLKLLLLGQWHSLSDRQLEESLKLRVDFLYFTGFTPTGDLPDHSTICRFRKALKDSNKLDTVLNEINNQLEAYGLAINNAHGSIIDASIIQSAARPNKCIEADIAKDRDEDNHNDTNISYSKDKDARWIKKGKKSQFGYKLFTGVDDKHGFIQNVHTTPASSYEAYELEHMLNQVDVKRIYADKAYDTQDNKDMLKLKKIKNAILAKAKRNKPLTQTQKKRNKLISKTRFKVEQCFGTLKRIFGFNRASYFGIAKVHTQAVLKACCFNMLKAVNMISI